MSVKSNGNATDKLGTSAEKNKWHLDCLLEKLRQQQQNKTFQELSKSVRMSLLEKRYAMDAIEKANLQKTLDNLQQYIQVKNVSRTWLVDTLSTVSRQLGLKFNIDNGLFISSDMFFIEINLNADDTVKEVNVHHEGAKEHYPCKELVTAISKGDFVDLTAQLEGLISIYQINAEKSVKCKAFVALQALETDLAHFSLLQASMTKDNYQMCMHSPLGLLQKRRGGHPMQITYFVSAYDLIDVERKQLVSSLTNDLINTKKIGHSVTVNLEASAATRLQIQPLLLISTDSQGCTTSAYSQMNQNNSCLLPATFVLKLNKPSAVGCQIVQEIERITEQKLANQNQVPLMSLIVSNASEGKITNIDRSMFVSLPDQHHCYFLSEMKEQAIQVTNIPFSDPQHVPKVIKLLRQQALFNTLIGSCVRTGTPKDFDSMQMFEITALSSQYITISLEHPYQQQLTTIEFDLSDMGNIGCSIYGGTQLGNISNKVAKVMQTCMSIPVTMRYLLKSWHQEYARVNLRKFDTDNYNMSLGSNDPGVEDDEYDPLAPSSNDNDYGQGRYSNSNETSGGNGGGSSDRIAEAMEKICGKPIKMEDVDDMFDESNTSCDSFSLAGTLETGSASSYDFDPKEVLEAPMPKKMKTEISITPIASSQSQFGQNVTLERRSGIEIIPLSSANAKDLPASITITPINNSKSEKRSSSGSSDGKSSEKKKKRKREDSQMGPPDPLSKPVNVSLHHLSSGSSPIHRNSSGMSSSTKQSPKHSPAHSASPKHQTFGSSPKHSISSPKHPSGAGGKPSMSTLKSAANSPKSLSNSPSSFPSSMSSSSSISMGGGGGGNGENGDKAAAQAKNRKIGSLTAVIDKLKSQNAQSPDDIFQYSVESPQSASLSSSASSSSTNAIQSNTSNNAQNTSSCISNNSGSSSVTSSAPNQSCTPSTKPSSEYMVKHSSDGMKITINKTKSKDKLSSGLTKSASFTSGSNSPKIHTGLKPGVNSGPASKKPSISSSKSSMSGIQKLPFQKSSSSGNLSGSTSGKVYSPSKSSSSSSSGGGIKEKSSKSSKSSSLGASSTDKYRADTTDIMKMLGFTTAAQGSDNFIKSSKFQIPKISARSSTGNTSASQDDVYRKEKSSSASHSAPNTPSTNTSSSVDFSSKLLQDFNKYPMSYSAATKLPGDVSPMHVPSAAAALNKISVGSSPKYNTQADTREAMNLETYHTQKINSMGLSFPPTSMHQSDTLMQEKANEIMKHQQQQQQQQQQQRSTTPSHSVHATVVKSPSPLIIIPSPRSNEHITDDDNLMEELVAITK